MRRAREAARNRIFSQFEKRFDVYSGTFFYHSNKTGVDTFLKPRVLRPDQVRNAPAVDKFGGTGEGDGVITLAR